MNEPLRGSEGIGVAILLIALGLGLDSWLFFRGAEGAAYVLSRSVADSELEWEMMSLLFRAMRLAALLAASCCALAAAGLARTSSAGLSESA